MNLCFGAYKAQCDGHLYTYNAAWEKASGATVCWDAQVRLDGRLVGSIHGELRIEEECDVPLTIRINIQQRIEDTTRAMAA